MKHDSSDELPSASQKIQPIYAASFSIAVSGTDITLICQRFDPNKVRSDIGTQDVASASVTTGTVVMGFHAAKDLSELLRQHIDRFEQDYGKFSTPFLLRGPVNEKK